MVSLTQVSNGSGVSSTTGPLQPLYSSSTTSAPVLVYPLDLGSGTKNHFVKFTIKQVNASAFVTGSETGSAVGKVTQNILNSAYAAPTTTVAGFVALYMPDTLNASFNADYAEPSITTGMGSLVSGLQYYNAVKDAKTKGSVISRDAALLDAATKSLTALAASVGLQGVIGDSFAPAVNNSMGVAINPQIQMIFTGVDFRSFQLAFTFSPSSAQEAQVIDSIINTFKYHYAPDILSPNTVGNGLFYTPPSYFNIEFMFGANENKYLPKYGDCVLQSIDVNYAPNGYASHVDGAPVQTQLTLAFKEMEIVTKTKLMTGATNQLTGGSTVGGLR